MIGVDSEMKPTEILRLVRTPAPGQYNCFDSVPRAVYFQRVTRLVAAAVPSPTVGESASAGPSKAPPSTSPRGWKPPERVRVDPPECWGCGRKGHFRRDCTSAGSRGKDYTTKVCGNTSEAKYIKECGVDGDVCVRGLMDTGCSVVLIREHKVREMNLKLIGDRVRIYGTGDVSTPATPTLGRVVPDSLQIDEALAEDIEAMVVPDNAIPEDLWVGRTFLDLPHLALLRVDDDFFVGSKESTLQKICRARSQRLRATDEVTIRLGAAALVKAATEWLCEFRRVVVRNSRLS